jgi:hypothetical protein
MKKLTIKVLNAILIIILTFVLALTIPLILSSIVVLLTSVTYTDCFEFPIFWIFFLIFLFISAFYINDLVNEL